MSAVDGIARLLHADGVGHYAPDDVIPDDVVPIGLVAFPPGGDTALVLTTYDGPEPDSSNAWEYPRLQVKVRATDQRDALALDRQVYEHLQERSGLLEDGSTLQDCYALQSEATYLGPDDNGRHEFTRNYQLSVDLAG